MIAICAATLVAVYGWRSWLAGAGLLMCAFMLASFVRRHGAAFKRPLLLRRPQELLFSLIHKVENQPHVYWLALGLALAETAVVRLTPGWLQFSVLLLPLVCALNALLHLRFIKLINGWFYRDHWLGHKSEFDFVYLHGSHHDAIPVGLIGVAGNGFLEGFLRHTSGNPMSLYSPLLACLLHSMEMLQDVRMHQYIPGVYPRLARSAHAVSQHSTHHVGRLEPYGIGLRMSKRDGAPRREAWFDFPPESLLNSIWQFFTPLTVKVDSFRPGALGVQ